jgi:ribosomal protein S5
MSFTSDGMEFSISQLGDGPTIQSNFMMFFGSVEVVMKAAPGAGIVSSFVMESDDLDEIDWVR